MQCVQFLKLQKGLNHSTLLYITDQLPIWRSPNTITVDKTLKTIMVDAIRIYIHSTSSQINIKLNRFNHFLTIQYSVLLLQLRYVLYPTLSPPKKMNGHIKTELVTVEVMVSAWFLSHICILTHPLQLWQTRFLCWNSYYFWVSVVSTKSLPGYRANAQISRHIFLETYKLFF